MNAKEIIKYWNSKDNVGIRHNNPDTKVYKTSITLIEWLMTGDFYSHCPLEDDYAESYGITIQELMHSWSEPELKEAIDRYNYMCSEQYIADKSYYPRNMSEFMYNPRTKKSFIMTVLGEWRDVPGRPLKSLYPAASQLYINTFWDGGVLSPVQYNIIIRNVNYIIMQQRSFEDKIGKWFYYHELKGVSFYHCHCDYIRQNHQDREGFDANHIGPMTYAGFILWVKEMYGLNINPLDKEIQMAKAQYQIDSEIMRANVEGQVKINAERLEWLKNRGNRAKAIEDVVEQDKTNTGLPEQNGEMLENFEK